MHFICFSHLRWNFVYQRPQHLVSRFARQYPTFYIEEFVSTDEEDGYSETVSAEGVIIVTPRLSVINGRGEDDATRLRRLLTELFDQRRIVDYICWYYTPMALAFTGHLNPKLIVFDCMDELSAFKFAPPALKEFEKDLLSSADLVFTGGNTLFQAKKDANPNVFSFPSSIDKKHFQRARNVVDEPADQLSIAQPRLGFFGVIDERFDSELIRKAAEARPSWNFILIGPVVKIDPATLPRAHNIHYLGGKSYDELPLYLSGWDVALIPFLINESTRYISPTKTPEYLAAGKPVLSTPITDVINPYATLGLVQIAHDTDEFLALADQLLTTARDPDWLPQVDAFLSNISWDQTWEEMNSRVISALNKKQIASTSKDDIYV